MPESTLEDLLKDESVPTPETGPTAVEASTPEDSTPGSLEELVGQEEEKNPLKAIGIKISDVYQKVADWANKPNEVEKAGPGAFVENLAKGTVGMGQGVLGLAALEGRGLMDWVKNPVENLKRLPEGPQVLKETVLMPMIQDLKEMFAHPIKYTYEKPISQILNISIVSGIGAGLRGTQEAAKIGRASAFLEEGLKAAKAGDVATAVVAREAVMGTMGHVTKSGLQNLSPKLSSLVEEIGYQTWLEKYSPLTSRGFSKGVTRNVKSLSKEKQLGEFAKEVIPGKEISRPVEPGGMKTVTESIRERAMADAADVIPEGKLDAINYERFLQEKASGAIKRIEVQPEYLGDYHSLKPVVSSLKKAVNDNPNVTNAIANHWHETILSMKNKEHGQSFVSKIYKPEGEIPKFPERIYPWISIKEKAPFPKGDISGSVEAKLRSPGQVMREAWGYDNPLVDAFEANQTASLNANNSFAWFNKLVKGIKPEQDMVKTAMAPYLNQSLILQNRLSLTTDAAVKSSISKEIVNNLDKAFRAQLELAKKSPDVRIQLYAAEQLPPELAKLMSTKEIKIAETIKAYYTTTGNDLKRVGLPTIQGKSYVRHLVAEELSAAGGDWTKLPEQLKKLIPRDLAFAHRSGEFDWYPSAIGAMNNYIPIVERKLAFQPYLMRWRDTVKASAMSGNKAAQEAELMIARNMQKASTLGSKVSNTITSMNYFLQLFGNARVAVKHIIGGMPGSWSEVGIFTAPQALFQMVKHPRESRELMQSFGRLQDVVKTLEMNSGIEYHSNRFIKAMANNPVAAVEYVENGVNILGNLMKGANKNIEPELLRRYIWNKVTSVNFRSGWDTPEAFAGPIRRIGFQYSLEPYKVWDYRFELVKRALAGERDIYGTTYGSKLIQYIGIIGGMEQLARSHGKTIVDTMIGTPFVDMVNPSTKVPGFQLQAPKAKLGPGVKLIQDVADKATKGDYLRILDTFVDYWLESGVGIVGQLMKASSGKLPASYNKDVLSYLLGLPEVAELERQGVKTARYLRYRSEKEESRHEAMIIKKNPLLKNIVIFKREFRKKLSSFMKNPGKHINDVYNSGATGPSDQPQRLEDLLGEETTNQATLEDLLK